eukprot:jgi/Botrbrau1/15647/Bobra.4_1s0031.1
MRVLLTAVTRGWPSIITLSGRLQCNCPSWPAAKIGVRWQQTSYKRCGPPRGSPSVPVGTNDREDDGVVLPPSTEDMLEFERAWIAAQLQAWLDEEWLMQPVHKDLSIFASEVYLELRKRGADDLGDVVLSLGTELLQFDYNDTFTGAFEVANKVSELLMLKMGVDVCCVSSADLERFKRVDQAFGDAK